MAKLVRIAVTLLIAAIVLGGVGYGITWLVGQRRQEVQSWPTFRYQQRVKVVDEDSFYAFREGVVTRAGGSGHYSVAIDDKVTETFHAEQLQSISPEGETTDFDAETQ